MSHTTDDDAFFRPPTGDPHSEPPLTPEQEQAIRGALDEMAREFGQGSRTRWAILRSLVRDVVGPVEYKLQDEQAVSKLRELACIRLEASLAASDQRLTEAHAMIADKIAASARAGYRFDSCPWLQSRAETAEAIAFEIRRAALDEAQKVGR